MVRTHRAATALVLPMNRCSEVWPQLATTYGSSLDGNDRCIEVAEQLQEAASGLELTVHLPNVVPLVV